MELRWEGTTTENALYMLVLTELKIRGPDPLNLHSPIFQIETRLMPSSIVKGWGITKWNGSMKLDCDVCWFLPKTPPN